MIAGHLQEKKGFYYAVLNYNDADKKRKTKWIATHLPVKGNKKKSRGLPDGTAAHFRNSRCRPHIFAG